MSTTSFVHIFYLFLVLPILALPAQAKTDISANTNSGTGGITITGVTNMTTYEYRAPDLSVTAINGAPVGNNQKVVPPPAPGSKTLTPEERGEVYDKTTRQFLNMPANWFKCATPDDCIVAHVPCNTGLAVSKVYKSDAQTLLCHGECVDACLKSLPDTSQAICKNGECRTVIQPYHPENH